MLYDRIPVCYSGLSNIKIIFFTGSNFSFKVVNSLWDFRGEGVPWWPREVLHKDEVSVSKMNLF